MDLSATKPIQLAPVAFGRLPFRNRLELRHGFAFFSEFAAEFAAFLGLAIEGLRHGGRSADFAEEQDLDLEFAAFVFHLKLVAEADVFRRLGGLAVRGDSAEFTGFGRESAGLEESGRPEPLVHSHAGVLDLRSKFAA